jgi:hypothetical protein
VNRQRLRLVQKCQKAGMPTPFIWEWMHDEKLWEGIGFKGKGEPVHRYTVVTGESAVTLRVANLDERKCTILCKVTLLFLVREAIVSYKM